MSGHSKWSSIKHKKAIVDARKGKLFSRLSVQISIAAKGGKDPEMNPNLRTMIEKAKTSGMSKENIERAVKRGSGELQGAILEEIQYEVFGPGGIVFLIQVVTDNKNRAISEIKSVLNKFGGNLGGSGSISHLFDRTGRLEVPLENDELGKEELEMSILDSGAYDYEFREEFVNVYASPSKIEEVKRFLENKKISVSDDEIIIMKPKNLIRIKNSAQMEKIKNLSQALNDLEDVTQVFSNVEL